MTRIKRLVCKIYENEYNLYNIKYEILKSIQSGLKTYDLRDERSFEWLFSMYFWVQWSFIIAKFEFKMWEYFHGCEMAIAPPPY